MDKANNSAPVPADHSTWRLSGGLLFRLRVPQYDVCLCVRVGSVRVGVVVLVVSVLGQNAGEVLSQSFREALIDKCFK